MKNHGNLEDLDEVQKREGNLQAEHSFPEKVGDLLDADDHYQENTEALNTGAAEDLAASAALVLAASDEPKLAATVGLGLAASVERELAASDELKPAESVGLELAVSADEENSMKHQTQVLKKTTSLHQGIGMQMKKN